MNVVVNHTANPSINNDGTVVVGGVVAPNIPSSQRNPPMTDDLGLSSEDNNSGSDDGPTSDDDDDVSYAGIGNRRRLTNNNIDGQQQQQRDNDDLVVSPQKIWKNITIEPMMFAHMFGFTTTSVVLQNLSIDRICRVKLGYNATEQNGRSYLILTHIPTVSPEVLLISSIPIACVGGLVALIMSAFSFIAKGTTEENRSFRVAMVEASWFLGGPLGILTGGVVYKYGGFTAVFCTSASFFLISFVYGVIVIREELPEIEGSREGRSCIGDMFNVEAVRDMFGTVFLRRSGLQRRWLLLLLFAISLRIFALFGYLQNMYLYTRHKFGWNIKEYTEYSVSDSFISISGGYVMIMTLMKIFKLDDAVIGIISTVGPFFAQFVFAFAVPGCGWMMSLGSSFQLFAGLISIVLRSMISKVVAKDEIARVYTFLACSEAAMPLIGVPLYSYIFRNTLETFPGAMFMVSAGAYCVVIFCFIYLYFSMRDSNNHEEMEDPTRRRRE